MEYFTVASVVLKKILIHLGVAAIFYFAFLLAYILFDLPTCSCNIQKGDVSGKAVVVIYHLGTTGVIMLSLVVGAGRILNGVVKLLVPLITRKS